MSTEYFNLIGEIILFALVFNVIAQLLLPSKWVYTKIFLNNSMLMQYKIYNLVWDIPKCIRYIKLSYFTRFGEIFLCLHWLLLIAFVIVMVLIGASSS